MKLYKYKYMNIVVYYIPSSTGHLLRYEAKLPVASEGNHKIWPIGVPGYVSESDNQITIEDTTISDETKNGSEDPVTLR